MAFFQELSDHIESVKMYQDEYDDKEDVTEVLDLISNLLSMYSRIFNPLSASLGIGQKVAALCMTEEMNEVYGQLNTRMLSKSSLVMSSTRSA